MRGDFSDVDAFFEAGRRQTEQVTADVGEAALAYAAQHGDYGDVTGRLRASYRKRVSAQGLELMNVAPYASGVEAKGFEVLATAALEAERLLRERIA